MSKEPKVNEENIAFEKAVRKEQKTIEDYIVSRLESLERTVHQQEAYIKLIENDFSNLVSAIKKDAKLIGGLESIRIYVEKDNKHYEFVKKLLGLGEQNE